MQDILVTIIIAWILFRLLRPVIFVQWNKPQKHYHNYYPPTQNRSADGEIKVTHPPQQNKQSSSSGKDDEYIDFEELPKS